MAHFEHSCPFFKLFENDSPSQKIQITSVLVLRQTFETEYVATGQNLGIIKLVKTYWASLIDYTALKHLLMNKKQTFNLKASNQSVYVFPSDLIFRISDKSL